MAGSSLRRLMAEYKRKYMHMFCEFNYLFKATSIHLPFFDGDCVGQYWFSQCHNTNTSNKNNNKLSPFKRFNETGIRYGN